MKRNHVRRVLEERERKPECLASHKQYYDYERFKKYGDPDPTLSYGAKIRKLSSELKI